MKASKYKMDSEFRMEIDRQIRHAMPEMHYHDFYEIYIQDLGTHEHIVSSSFFKLSPHDVMLLKPHILHQSISWIYIHGLLFILQINFSMTFLRAGCKGTDAPLSV